MSEDRLPVHFNIVAANDSKSLVPYIISNYIQCK